MPWSSTSVKLYIYRSKLNDDTFGGAWGQTSIVWLRPDAWHIGFWREGCVQLYLILVAANAIAFRRRSSRHRSNFEFLTTVPWLRRNLEMRWTLIISGFYAGRSVKTKKRSKFVELKRLMEACMYTWKLTCAGPTGEVTNQIREGLMKFFFSFWHFGLTTQLYMLMSTIISSIINVSWPPTFMGCATWKNSTTNTSWQGGDVTK